MNCSANDCKAEAVCACRLKVPAMNMPIAEHDPIEVVLGLTLCEQHFKELKPQDFFTPDHCGNLEQIVRMRARGRPKPDFKRAFFERLEFTSPEWAMMVQMKKKPKDFGQ